MPLHRPPVPQKPTTEAYLGNLFESTSENDKNKRDGLLFSKIKIFGNILHHEIN